MRKALGLMIVLALAGCKDQICHCPLELNGPGWCHSVPPGATDCVASCGITVPCPGYCLPDGSFSPSVNPHPCDAGR